MQEVNRLQGKWRTVVFLLAALLVVALDQLSKLWIRSNLLVGQSLPETGFFQLTHIRNTGAAFGLFQGQSFPLTIVASIGVVVLLVCGLVICRRFPFLDSMLGRAALGMILGGTIGNLIDRLTTDLHYVTDFISVGIWPTFNIADSAIVVGGIIFAYILLLVVKAEKQ